MRLAGVIRLSAPSWSSAPQRPQFRALSHALDVSLGDRGCGAACGRRLSGLRRMIQCRVAENLGAQCRTDTQGTYRKERKREFSEMDHVDISFSAGQPAECGENRLHDTATGSPHPLTHDCGLPAREESEAAASANNCLRLSTDAASHCASRATSSAQMPLDGVHVSRNMGSVASPRRMRRSSEGAPMLALAEGSTREVVKANVGAGDHVVLQVVTEARGPSISRTAVASSKLRSELATSTQNPTRFAG